MYKVSSNEVGQGFCGKKGIFAYRMKKILRYLGEYYRSTWNWPFFFALVIFLSGMLYVNYGLGLTQDLIYRFHYRPVQFFLYVALLGGVFMTAFLLQGFFTGNWEFIRKPRFWALFGLAVCIFAYRMYFWKYKDWVEVWFPEHLQHWAGKCLDNVFEPLIVMVPISLYWYWFDRDWEQRLYGFTLKNYDLKPYLVMLAVMVPLIAIASFSGDFLTTYPTAGRIYQVDIETGRGKLLYAVYELFYGFDFIFIEFFFRGFLVMAFARVVGTKAILPMCAFYVAIHFGKPMGEAISSFFGGLLLGIIAYYSRSIAGGIIVHIGIAWLMEIGAFLKKIL